MFLYSMFNEIPVKGLKKGVWERERAMVLTSLPSDGCSRELGFVPCQRSVATVSQKRKKQGTEGRERKE